MNLKLDFSCAASDYLADEWNINWYQNSTAYEGESSFPRINKKIDKYKFNGPTGITFAVSALSLIRM